MVPTTIKRTPIAPTGVSRLAAPSTPWLNNSTPMMNRPMPLLRMRILAAANMRMRNSGIGLFIMGVLLLSQGVDGAANRLTPVGAMGVLFIVVGTICFLWGWKLNQLEK